MKNIYLLPTDKPSELYINMQGVLSKSNSLLLRLKSRNIYITSDEEIKEGDWCIDEDGLMKCTAHSGAMNHYFQKIILTTDQDLIKNGVQAIDDEFLEWFVKNQSCEEVVVTPYLKDIINSLTNEKYPVIQHRHFDETKMICEYKYEIIIPKEESKKETLEEVPTELDSVLAKISHQNDLGLSQWYEVVYYTDGKWCSYSGSKTFQDGERVLEWKYCKDLI